MRISFKWLIDTVLAHQSTLSHSYGHDLGVPGYALPTPRPQLLRPSQPEEGEESSSLPLGGGGGDDGPFRPMMETEIVTVTVPYKTPDPMVTDTVLVVDGSGKPATTIYYSTSTLKTVTTTVSRGAEEWMKGQCGECGKGEKGGKGEEKNEKGEGKYEKDGEEKHEKADLKGILPFIFPGPHIPLIPSSSEKHQTDSPSTSPAALPIGVLPLTAHTRTGGVLPPWPKATHPSPSQQGVSHPSGSAGSDDAAASPSGRTSDTKSSNASETQDHHQPHHVKPQHGDEDNGKWSVAADIWSKLSETMKELRDFAEAKEQGECDRECHEKWASAEKSWEKLSGLMGALKGEQLHGVVQKSDATEKHVNGTVSHHNEGKESSLGEKLDELLGEKAEFTKLPTYGWKRHVDAALHDTDSKRNGNTLA